MTYNGQRGPNVAEFIANLNAIPTAQDIAVSDDANFEDDLAMFTNTQFFDFDLGHDADVQPQNHYRFDGVTLPPPVDNKLNFDVQGDFSYPDFGFQQAGSDLAANGMPGFPPASGPAAFPASSPTTSASATSPVTGEKRKASTQTEALEEASRAAAEEDKRRRNTAASARFRVKKKQREQALEKSAKEMSDKVLALEGRIGQLETENKWLKNLVIEKNGDNKDNIADLWRKYNEAAAERKGDTRKDGVGTDA